MNTNKLKSFAKEARLILMEGVEQRLKYWGFDKKGKLTEELETIDGGYIFRGDVFNDTSVPAKWNRLVSAVKKHTAADIIEEAAYTWFNRLIAIKILEENNYIDPVLNYVSEDLTDPVILDEARKGKHGKLRDIEKDLLKSHLLDGSKDEEAFALLLIAYCRNQKLLKKVFGHIDDYTELLIPSNLLSGDGIVELINESDAITSEDYKEVELIGWLYQFYISDKKDEVFAGFKKKKKARAEDIPAATQIFTPKWIVKYMVENTVGRIWLDKHPNSPIHDEMKYLVEPADKENYKPEPIINDVTELTLLDPACGSGHILVVGFDLLMKMYLEEGYSKRNAVESIIENNLYGLDIDDRATQLANFAVLLKAASYYAEILEKDVEPKIYSMPEPQEFSRQDIYDFLGGDGKEYAEELEVALTEMQQAKNIGSALKLTLNDDARGFIGTRNSEQKEESLFGNLKPFINVALILTNKFNSVVANPPYLGYKNINGILKDYLETNYPNTKSDLFAVFMEVMINCGTKSSHLAIINQWAWMCIDSYKNFRRSFLDQNSILSLLHLGIGVFPEMNTKKVQNVCFVFKKEGVNKFGSYFKLDLNFNVSVKEKQFLNKENRYIIDQNKFSNIPDAPFAFWLPPKLIKEYKNGNTIDSFINAKQGLATGKNERFVRNWQEVSKHKIGFGFASSTEALKSRNKWFPYNKGGGFRRWYGNQFFVVNWENDGYEIRNFYDNNGRQLSRPQNTAFYFKEGITWSLISLTFSARYAEKGSLFDVGGSSGFPMNEHNIYLVGLLNSKVSSYLLGVLNFTLNVQVGDIKRILYIIPNEKQLNIVKQLVQSQIDLSKLEWDNFEFSWNFCSHGLIKNLANQNIENAYYEYVQYWKERFYKLHKNEEELNRIFIDMYDLRNELVPDIELKAIAILQDETYINENNELVFNKDIIIQQFLSYSIGCMFGRYRLDNEGLQIAHPNPAEEEIAPYKISSPLHNGTKEVTFEIDDDAIIPMMGSESPFSDDIYLRVKHFVEIVWGDKTLTENLNFINECLDMDLEKFLTDKFWQFHCKMYKKTPIYWLFSSPTGAFKVLVYMHRMNKYTVQKIRNNYLLKHLQYLRGEIAKLEKNESSLTRQEAKRLDKLRDDEIECNEYDLLVKDYADKQIEFDLDDGVKNNHKLFEDIVAPIK